MASSLNKSISDPGTAAGSGFGFSWRSPKPPGPETVITNPRISPLSVIAGDGVGQGDLVPRLFPLSHDAENVAGITIGHFTIQKRIGIGGMGSVFLAADERLKRDVALKVLAPQLSLDQTSVQRFQNEAQAAARLDHDNIARVFYSGEESGLHYIAYEYVPGQNLRDLIRAKGWLDPSEAVNYTIQLTAALHHSSSAGVIHRDIKPSNVLITPFGRAKLVDLGLARKTSVESSFELTVPGTTLGTFDYISPEQARDPHRADVRSDIYSLGCTLYHMLTGEPPYPEGTVLQKLLDHHDKDPPNPAKKNRRVSPTLSRIVRKMMASQPAHRYASPGDLLRELLIEAKAIGSGAVPIDGQVWLTATRFKPPFWQSNFGWVATTCALCLMVAAVQVYPQLTQKAIRRPIGLTKPDRVIEPAETIATAERIEFPKTAAVPSANTVDVAPRPADDLLKSPLVGTAFDANTKFEPTNSTTTTAAGPTSPTSAHSAAPTIPKNDSPAAVAVRPTRSLPPATVEERQVVVPAETVAAVQIVNGKSYPSLEAACAEAADSGSIIELRYNGLREPERPIRLANKKVIIRGVEGYRPTVRFTGTESSADGNQPHMITVAGGLLELENIDLVMTIPNRVGSDRWAMFSLERPEKVQLNGVTLTVANPHYKPACLFEQRAPLGQGLESMGLRKDGMPVVPPELLLTACLVRGIADFVVMRDPVPARFDLKDTAIGVDGNLLQVKLVMDTVMERESITLELDNVRCRLGQSLLSVEGSGGLTEKLPAMFLFARKNIISCGQNRPLISMRGLADFMDFQQSFSWKGDLNSYDNIDTFLEIATPQLSSSRNLDHSGWKLFWASNEGIGSTNAPVAWRTRSVEHSFTSVTRENFDLATESQPSKGNSDGYMAGSFTKKLPPLDK